VSRFGRGRGPRDYHVYVQPNQLGRERGESVGSFPVPPALDENVLALDVPQLLHPLEESLPGGPASRGLGRGTPEKAKAIDFRGRLRIDRERRSEEHTGQRAEERPPRGHRITSSARAGTLRECGERLGAGTT
jgi:hypothetical protein